jgi:hypothetical protein
MQKILRRVRFDYNKKIGLRGSCYGLRVARYGLRVASCAVRGARYELLVARYAFRGTSSPVRDSLSCFVSRVLFPIFKIVPGYGSKQNSSRLEAAPTKKKLKYCKNVSSVFQTP